MSRVGAGRLQQVAYWSLTVALFALVAMALHGWVRAAALALLLGLAHLGRRRRQALRAASLRACDEAVRANEERLRDRGALQAALANDLKNPLAAVKGLSGLMALDPEKAAQRLPVLQAEVGRMHRIIDRLLDFSQPLTPMAPRTVDARLLLARVAELHEAMAARHLVEVVVEPGAPIELYCDPVKLKHALMCLVRNAVEASPAGGRVTLTAIGDGTQVRLAVLDRGPGIAAGELSRVVRAGVSSKPDADGLGLTIADALVRQHGGTLVLANRSDGGLVAELALPLACRDAVAGYAA